LIWPGCLKLPVDLAGGPIERIIRNARPTLPAAPGALYLKLLHQPLNRTASNINAFPQQLPVTAIYALSAAQMPI